jgi:hypothetical protein
MEMKTKMASREFAEKEVARLKIAFPNNPDDFFCLLIERILANDFFEIQLEKAIDYVIDTVEQDKLSIADVIELREKFITIV